MVPAKILLNLIQRPTVVDFGPWCKAVVLAAVFFRLVGHDGQMVDSLGVHLPADGRRIDVSVDGLPPGHGYGIVVQNFVGDIDTGRHTGANCQQARVKIGPVAQVLKDVFGFDETRHADPVCTFASHVRVGDVTPRHVGRHVVTADTAVGPTAVWDPGRGIVGAAGTEEGRSDDAERPSFCPLIVLGFKEGEPMLDCGTVVKRSDAVGDGASDLVRTELANFTQEPTAVFVATTRYPRPILLRYGVQYILDCELQNASFFFNDQDFI